MNQTSTRRRVLLIAGITFALIMLVAFYALVPIESGWMPRCTFKSLTGLDCPGCGSQRAIQALLHGHIATAWNFNPALFFAVPLIAILLGVEAMPGRFKSLRKTLLSPQSIIFIFILIIFWTIFRNL